MTEALEIRTPYADVSDVVRELATSVDDLSIRLPCERPIPDGDWVRFAILLTDGSTVFEGIGRSQGTRPDGPRYLVHLSLLQFDARNEVMFERMLLARDAEAERTGTLDLNELGVELVRGPSRSSLPPSRVPPPPPRPSTPPRGPASAAPIPKRPTERPAPPVRRAPSERPRAPKPTDTGPSARASAAKPRQRPRDATPSTAKPSAPPPKSGAARAQASAPPPRPSVPPRPSALPPVPSSKLPSATLPSAATRDDAPAAKPRATPAKRDPAKSATTTAARVEPAPGDAAATREGAKAVAARDDEPAPARSDAPKPGAAAATHTSSAAPEPIAGAADEGATAEHRPPPARDRRRRRPARVSVDAPTFDTVVSRPEDRGIRLDVSAVLVARARAMAPNLPAEVLGDDDASEEAVLRAALRLGLAALAALSDDED